MTLVIELEITHWKLHSLLTLLIYGILGAAKHQRLQRTPYFCCWQLSRRRKWHHPALSCSKQQERGSWVPEYWQQNLCCFVSSQTRSVHRWKPWSALCQHSSLANHKGPLTRIWLRWKIITAGMPKPSRWTSRSQNGRGDCTWKPRRRLSESLWFDNSPLSSYLSSDVSQ